MQIENWGLISYAEALDKQLQKVEEVINGGPETLIVCWHPPVVTLGRGTKPGDVTSWSGETVEVSRGGRATYHGPGQVVVYPILNLNQTRPALPARDLHAYMRLIEQAVQQTLLQFDVPFLTDIKIAAKADIKNENAEASFTGVWVQHKGSQKKIASIGIGVKKWVSYHGLALNVGRDPMANKGINPCGFQSDVMISMQDILGDVVNQNIVAEKLTTTFCRLLSRTS